jgi:hypothetical protein
MTALTEFESKLQDRIIGNAENTNRPAFQSALNRTHDEPDLNFSDVLREEETKLRDFPVHRMVIVSISYFISLLLMTAGLTAALISSVFAAWPVATAFAIIGGVNLIIERLLHPNIKHYQSLLLYPKA